MLWMTRTKKTKTPTLPPTTTTTTTRTTRTTSTPPTTTKQILFLLALVISCCVTVQIYYATRTTTTTTTTTRTRTVLLPPPPPPTTTTTTTTTANVATISSTRVNGRTLPLTVVSKLEPLDYEKFTVRLHTWKRAEALPNLLHNLLSCERVAVVQIIWCLGQGNDIPQWLLDRIETQQHDEELGRRLQLEIHDTMDSSLNARFHVLKSPPTRGILSQDDDLVRPCLALDVGFAIWTRNPERMVGYYPRSFAIRNNNNNNNNTPTWYYDGHATAAEKNVYAFTLTKFAFLHVDYLHSYIHQMPPMIRQYVAQITNCEDIAMSLWISSQTKINISTINATTTTTTTTTLCLPPLLADKWACDSTVQIQKENYKEQRAISDNAHHIATRSLCLDRFATILQIKDCLRPVQRMHYKTRQPLLRHQKKNNKSYYFEMTHYTGTANNGKYFQFGMTPPPPPSSWSSSSSVNNSTSSSNDDMPAIWKWLIQLRQDWGTQLSNTEIDARIKALRWNLTMTGCRKRFTARGKPACLL